MGDFYSIAGHLYGFLTYLQSRTQKLQKQRTINRRIAIVLVDFTLSFVCHKPIPNRTRIN